MCASRRPREVVVDTCTISKKHNGYPIASTDDGYIGPSSHSPAPGSPHFMNRLNVRIVYSQWVQDLPPVPGDAKVRSRGRCCTYGDALMPTATGAQLSRHDRGQHNNDTLSPPAGRCQDDVRRQLLPAHLLDRRHGAWATRRQGADEWIEYSAARLGRRVRAHCSAPGRL